MAHHTQVALVGLGMMGRIYRARLSAQAEFEVVSIDPDPDAGADYRAIELALRHSPAPDLWVVCSPTSTHLESVRHIVRHRPDARVLVEKPAGALDDLVALVGELRQHAPGAHVVLSDLYGTGRFRDMLKRGVTALGEDITEIRVELSKDRREDELVGRFVCSDYGTYGYEWLHILRILSTVVPGHRFAAVLERPAPSETFDGGRWSWELRKLRIVAASHVDGTVAMPELTDSPCGCRAHVPGRSRRLRVISGDGASLHVNLDDGRTSHFTLTTDHSGRPRARCVDVSRSDAVVDAVRALRDRATPPDPWTSLAVPTHVMLTRLYEASTRHNRDRSLEYA